MKASRKAEFCEFFTWVCRRCRVSFFDLSQTCQRVRKKAWHSTCDARLFACFGASQDEGLQVLRWWRLHKSGVSTGKKEFANIGENLWTPARRRLIWGLFICSGKHTQKKNNILEIRPCRVLYFLRWKKVI